MEEEISLLRKRNEGKRKEVEEEIEKMEKRRQEMEEVKIANETVRRQLVELRKELTLRQNNLLSCKNEFSLVFLSKSNALDKASKDIQSALLSHASLFETLSANVSDLDVSIPISRLHLDEFIATSKEESHSDFLEIDQLRTNCDLLNSETDEKCKLLDMKISILENKINDLINEKIDWLKVCASERSYLLEESNSLKSAINLLHDSTSKYAYSLELLKKQFFVKNPL